MKKSLSEQFGGWAIPFRDKLRSDPFLAARLKIAFLYFIVGLVVFIALSDLFDSFLRESLYKVAVLESGQAVEDAFRDIQTNLWIGRIVRLLLLAAAAYFLADYAMRPIKRNAEFQKRFIDNASHEMKTPISVIKTTSEVALHNRKALTLDDAVQVLESNAEEADRLAGIIQFLMFLTDLESRHGIFPVRPVHLEEVVKKCAALARADSSTAKVKINLENPDNSVVIPGNFMALEQMVTNLISNAIKYSPQGGEVRIRLEKAGNNQLKLIVSDTGSGIPEDALPYVFEPFYRARTNSHAERKPGLGLGLSIVKEIVKIHRGDIRITSEQGVGTKVTVWLPTA